MIPIWKHKRTGGEYAVIYQGQMKDVDTGAEWKRCIVYREVNGKNVYVRGFNDFRNKFEFVRHDKEPLQWT